MNNYSKNEELFVASAAVDYVSLLNIVNIVDREHGDFDTARLVPTEEEFIRALDFIAYLFRKYGKHLRCSTGAGAHPVNKAPKDLICWLKDQYDAGKYTEIHYGIWFELDMGVIPREYIPEEYTN